jgi:hypothetical protein
MGWGLGFKIKKFPIFSLFSKHKISLFSAFFQNTKFPYFQPFFQIKNSKTLITASQNHKFNTLITI